MNSDNGHKIKLDGRSLWGTCEKCGERINLYDLMKDLTVVCPGKPNDPVPQK